MVSCFQLLVNLPTCTCIWFGNLAEEERACCVTLIVFLMPCGCLCSVFLPRGASGWPSLFIWCDLIYGAKAIFLFNVRILR